MNDRDSIVEALRTRVLRGLKAGTLRPGERLPSARELMAEFGADHRLILSAYRRLAEEGFVEIRERGGVYVVASGAESDAAPPLPAKWIVDTLAEGYTREVGGPELVDWLRRSLETLRLRAMVVSSTADQVRGLARELRDDFGLDADGVVASELSDPGVHVAALKRADILLCTSAHVALVERLGAELDKPVLTIEIRPDLNVGEWALLLRQPVWAVVATREFGEMLLRFFANVRGVENLHVLVYGMDDLSTIPEGAPTYVTHRVREQLGTTRIKGHVLPAARTISVESARAILDLVVRANLRALQSVSMLGAAPARGESDSKSKGA